MAIEIVKKISKLVLQSDNHKDDKLVFEPNKDEKKHIMKMTVHEDGRAKTEWFFDEKDVDAILESLTSFKEQNGRKF